MEKKQFSLKAKLHILVSACLFGKRCRYDGADSLNPYLLLLKDLIEFVPFCPEQLGGLPTPRPPANIFFGDGMDVLMGRAKVINAEGVDVTENFKRGAYRSLDLAKRFSISVAIVRKRSPSCGIKTPYCEHPSGYGIGVTAALFRLYGIKTIELGKDDFISLKEIL